MKLIHKITSHPLPMVVVGAFMFVALGVFLLTPTHANAKVTPNINICHASSSTSNPYTTQSVDMNGTAGGHDDHIGGIFPANPWGDIIPTYDYQNWEVVSTNLVCPSGYSPSVFCPSSQCRKNTNPHNCKDKIVEETYGWVTRHFPGLNWNVEGQAIYNNGCAVPPFCGDGIKNQPSEECDGADGLTPHYLCNDSCKKVYVPYCGDGIVNQDREQCDGQPGCDMKGDDMCTWDYATINAKKIVCDNESSLPNWGNGSANITSSTATNYVNSHEDCKLVDWNFQWAPDGTANPGDNTGAAGGAWTTFASGNTNVIATGGKLWLREVWDSNYIPFTYSASGNSDNQSAEFYCNDDVLNYDNYDYITSVESGHNYYCVGFNVLNSFTIEGYKFNDLNGNGLWSCVQNTLIPAVCEPKLADWKIFLDKNGNETFDDGESFDMTDASGNYKFEGLAAGTYSICEVQQNGWQRTAPSDTNCYSMTLPTKGDYVAPNFGNQVIPTYSFTGYKWNDLDGNGTRNCVLADAIANTNISQQIPNCEPFLAGWTIQLKKGGEIIKTDITSDVEGQAYGSYHFDGLLAGTYEVCEVLQSGWAQTYPVTPACHTITLPEGSKSDTCYGVDVILKAQSSIARLPMCNFGNQEIPKICGDGIVNQATEECDGTAGLTGSQTCSTDCKIVNPKTPVITFTLSKKVDKTIANPNDTLTYTIVVTNTGNAAATNVTLTDTLPAGLTYLDANGNNTGDTTKTWTWATIAAGASETVTYKTHVDSNATAKQYVNSATVKAEGVPGVTAQATSEVRTPTVLGDETSMLAITKTAKEKTVNPGGTVNFTVTVTNNGNTPALNVVLNDTLPQGMVFADNKTTTHSWNLGDLVPTESASRTYAVKVDSGTLPGKYVNTAVAKADSTASVSAQANVEVIAGKVLGEETDVVPTVTTLPSTGNVGLLPSLIAGLSILGSGLILARRIK